jgi:hypothetical protein
MQRQTKRVSDFPALIPRILNNLNYQIKQLLPCFRIILSYLRHQKDEEVLDVALSISFNLLYSLVFLGMVT